MRQPQYSRREADAGGEGEGDVLAAALILERYHRWVRVTTMSLLRMEYVDLYLSGQEVVEALIAGINISLLSIYTNLNYPAVGTGA